MNKNLGHPNQINLNHICTNTHVLPSDFFTDSIFGKSLIYKSNQSPEHTPSDLHISFFKKIGFPSNFCETLEYGLPLLLGANPPQRLVPNHISATLAEHRDFITSTLNKWQNMNILSYVEHQPHIVNPFSVVVKGSKKRLVLDARSSGLNDHIVSPKFKLPNADDIVGSLHSGNFMLKLDLANGFLQLPVCKNERTYLGFRNPIDGRFGVLNRLSFGLRSAPFLFTTFTCAVKQAALQFLNLKTEVYIDDWFLTNTSLDLLSVDHKRFNEFLDALGIAIQHEKTEGPAQCITYLGLMIDTSSNQIRLPETKRVKYQKGLEELLIASHPTMAHLAQTAGQLVHISSVHRAGAAHIQPLWEVLYKERKQWTRAQLERHGLSIDSELLSCLLWWKETLSIPNIQRKIWESPTGELFLWSKYSVFQAAQYSITLCTDASNEGWGASTGVHTITGTWSNRQKRLSINWRELKAVSLAINSFDSIKNSPVIILTDSVTVVAALSKRASCSQALQNLILELNDIEVSRNIEIVAYHIPGSLNDLPDRLSRGLSIETATPLLFDPLSTPSEIRNATQLYGMKWTGHKETVNLFYRDQFLLLSPQTSVIAVTTPDIPFLKRQLHHLANHTHDIFLLIPKIPTSDYPLPLTSIVENSSAISCLDAPDVKWFLLKIK